MVAQKTRFGFAVFNAITDETRASPQVLSATIDNERLDKQLKIFWEIESISAEQVSVDNNCVNQCS